jgi:NAD-dependent deacetylase
MVMLAPEPMESLKLLVHAAADRLLPVRRLLVLAGAGCSADAGIPTFRDDGGWWREYRPEDLATPEAFAQDPELVWTWYRERRSQIRAAQPHGGQRSLALLQKHFYDGQVLVATTNEDDLLERAGIEPVLHLHGSIFDTTCSASCGWPGGKDTGDSMASHRCPCCGAPTRPGSVWYGESLPVGLLEAIQAFDPDGCLVIGSSNIVQPVAGIPIEMALARQPVVEVNPQATPLSDLALHLPGPAAQVLPALVDLLTSATMRDQRRRLS